MNLAGARLARQAADEVGRLRRRLGRAAERLALGLAEGRRRRASAPVTFDQVRDAYAEQIAALAEGGVDLLLIETIFDTLNAKAAIAAALDVAPELPRWLSFTAIDASGRNLSGQTVEAFWASVEHAEPADRRRQLLARRGADAPLRRGPRADRATRTSPATRTPACRTSSALHDEQPADTSRYLGEFARDGPRQRRRRLLRHDARARPGDRGPRSRVWPRDASRRGRPAPRFSGLEPFEIGADTGFVMIGERTNVTGSARFRRLIEAGDFQGAVEVALEQVQGGANLLDVNMDADLLDSERGDDDVPQPDRDRAGDRAAADHGRQLALVGARGRAEVHPGEGHRQLDQPQGGRGGVPRAGARASGATAPASS